ncbi:hypothetical protein Dimus_028969 [Dionaea muscipula]
MWPGREVAGRFAEPVVPGRRCLARSSGSWRPGSSARHHLLDTTCPTTLPGAACLVTLPGTTCPAPPTRPTCPSTSLPGQPVRPPQPGQPARLASILGVPGKNGICEYIKDVWEESKYTKPLEITRRFANNETLTAARRVKFDEMKPFQRFIHFLVMKNLIPRFGKRDTSSFMDLTYMDHLMARRRRDDVVNTPEEEDEEKGGNQAEFDWEAVIDEAAVEGESRSDEQFYDAQVDVEEPVTETPAAPEVVAQASVQQKETTTSGVDPSCPMVEFQKQ